MEEKKEPWMQSVALATTLFAVFAAIASLKGSSYSTRVQLMTTEENSSWSYYQAKSIKQNICQLQVSTFEGNLINATPEKNAYYANKIDEAKKEISRYDKEKKEIFDKASKLGEKEKHFQKQSGNFHIAVMFLQIAIMLNSVGALLKQKQLWIVGVIVGLFGAIYFINGFFLLF